MRHEHDFSAVAAERVSARGELVVVAKADRTRIERLYQEGAAKLRMPTREADPLEAVLINTAGGLTGGDRLDWAVTVGEGASAVVTTQACEKLYRASSGTAEVGCRLSVAAGGRLAWLPQETIVFDNSAICRRIDLDLAPGAEALIMEATVFGRRAMGEQVRHARFSDRWRVWRRGSLIHAEDFAVGPEIDGQLASRAALGGAEAFATVLLFSEDAAANIDAARAIIGEAGGASAWEVAGSGKLLARLVAGDGYTLRRRLIPLLELLNERAGLPKVWTL
ncbi:urease accessory protein UreD [Mesorhizobium sp. BAC0120]|uniref:urease accessory protein UreD n=1 Tax=Mesorhizobium sp. BAC0120 TaxID=3090670 RepID=UPI00298D0178|nr:urease accessory protein UreD [Mesorhizobium sp. BAC0120]MDW6024639.1 urease accessory protein UreD [Mesorhizobium sp. BAC0120]